MSTEKIYCIPVKRISVDDAYIMAESRQQAVEFAEKLMLSDLLEYESTLGKFVETDDVIKEEDVYALNDSALTSDEYQEERDNAEANRMALKEINELE